MTSTLPASDQLSSSRALRPGAAAATASDAPHAATVPRGMARLRDLVPWLRDGVAIAYLMTGGYAYDPRIAITPDISWNQVLGAILAAHLATTLWRHRARGMITAHTTLTTLLVLTVWLAFRSLGTVDPDYARFKVLAHPLLILPVLLHVDLHVRSRADVGRILALWALATLGLLVLSVPHMLSIRSGQRLSVLAGGPNVFARLIGTGILCTWGVGHARTLGAWDRRRILELSWVPVGIWALVLAGTKAVFLSLPLALGLTLWRRGSRRALRRAWIVVAALCVVPFLAHPFVQDQPKDGGLVRLLRLPDVEDPLGSFGARIGFLDESREQIFSHPWLGVGTGAWGVSTGVGAGTYPHNIVLEITSELGVIGLLLVLIALSRYPRRWSAALQSPARPWTLVLVSLVVFWGFNVQLSGDLVDSRYFWLFVLLLEIWLRRADTSGPDTRTV